MSNPEFSPFIKSSFCDTAACVEARRESNSVILRNSGSPEAGEITFTLEEWAVFLRGARNGEFNFDIEDRQLVGQ